MADETIKLSTFEPPVRRTIQGDGILLGTPMVFVRTHGCDYSCSFCDTKDSWREGSVSEDVTPAELANRVREEANGVQWVAITGGNPLLHASGLLKFVETLRSSTYLPSVLLETQASFTNSDVRAFVEHLPVKEFLLSLSPKLHDWRMKPIFELLFWSLVGPGELAGLWQKRRKAQIKVVVSSEEDCQRALGYFDDIRLFAADAGIHPEQMNYILLPEYSLGRKNVETAIRVLGDAYKEGLAYQVRVIPQLHKLTLFVP